MAKTKRSPLVVITGASSGIGAATAQKYVELGYRVVLLARRVEKLELMKKKLKGKASFYPLDVTSQEMVSTVIAQIEKKEGPIDILVNNAGAAFGLELAQEAELSDWKRCVDLNINGVLYCTRAALTSMVKRNYGHIVNLGSIAGHYAYPGGNVYGATKAFVHHFSMNLRADLFGTAVRVSCIEPGLVSGTEFSVVRFRGDKKRVKTLYEKTEALTPEDIADAIVYCTSCPKHVNINTLEMMPVSQAPTHLAIARR
ncbi:MAG: SDR family NAD(P)-dependent oxidoreductase [Rhabdochlamydiaceae bacterium]|nr:SDR family NAD(P)-dependent oxidoreductase [Rhabdochlamydiaceae bacterium]